VKLKKSQLKEMIRQAIVEDIMDKEIKNPKTGNMIKVRTALQLPDDHPANKKAKDMVAKTPTDDKPKKKKGFLSKLAKLNPFSKKDDEPKEKPDSLVPDGPQFLGNSTKEGEDAEEVHDRVGEFIDDNEGNIPEEYVDKLKDLQKKAEDIGLSIFNNNNRTPAGTRNKIKELNDEAQEMMDDIEQKAMDGEFDESIKESIRRKYTIKEVRMWMKKLEENRYKKVYNSDARRVAWMVNNEGVEISEMPKSMSKKWTKAQYGRERYLANEFIKSKSEQMNEGKLTEGFKKIAKKNVKYKDKTGTYNWQIESGIDTDVMGGNTPKIILSYQHEDEKGFPTSGGNFFWLKEKDGTPYTPQKAKALVNKISNKKIGDFHRKSTKPSGSGNLIVMKGNKFIREGKLTSEQKLRKVIREILKEQLNEKTFGSQAQYMAYRKKHNLKPGSKHKVAGKTVTVRDVKKISKSAAKSADKFAAAQNAKMDAAEKAMKAKKKIKEQMKEDFKNNKWEVYVADEKGKEKIVKVAKSKRAGVILYNKLINTDKFHEVGMRVIKEEKVNEAKMVKLILPIKDRKKAVHILQKQLKLKVTKDFEYGGKKGSNFEIELDKKFENKVIELFMKSKIKVRG